jgi:HNH endonuclease
VIYCDYFNYISGWQRVATLGSLRSPASTNRRQLGGLMKLIDISTPKYPNTFTMVDDEDYDWLNQWKWYLNTDRYVIRANRVCGVRKTTWMHRELIKPEIGVFVDHIDGNKLDNRKGNLRICTPSENSRNRGPNKSRNLPKGAHWKPRDNIFHSQIKVNYKAIHLGRFATAQEAANAYNEAAIKYHGEFARINKPIEANQ